MKLYAVIMMMLVFSLPLVQAQAPEQPAVPQEQPIVPPDLASALTGTGGGSAIAFILDIVSILVAGVLDFIDTLVALVLDFMDTFVALLFDAIDTFVALIMSFCYGDALSNCLFSWAAWVFTCCGCIPWGVWLNCCPIFSFIPHTLRALRSTLQFCGL